MKNQPSSKKSLIIIVVIVVAALLVYFYYSSSSAPASSSTLTETQTASSLAASTRVLNLLNQINSLHIDTAIFKDAAYQTLTDYSVAIPPVNVGRPNPFAPLPGFIPASSGSGTTQ